MADADSRRAERVAAALGAAQRCLAEVAAGVEHVFLALVHSEIVEQVLVHGAAIDRLAAGATIIDAGSSRPKKHPRPSPPRAADRDIAFVDAPVFSAVSAPRREN